MNKHRKFINVLSVLMVLVLAVSAVPFSASAAPAKPVLKNDPMNGQILPFYEVWLRWYDVSNEHHYTMTIRDLGMGGNTGDAGPLIYNQQYVSQNATYFIVPTSKLTRGHHYRWCLNSVDANGNRTIADQHIFAIEEHTVDRHFVIEKETGIQITPMTNTMEYFIYAPTTQYDSIFQQAAEKWNGIANVNLVRTATPCDGHYEIEIYESSLTSNPGKFGITYTGWNASKQVVSSKVHIFNDNIVTTYSKYANLFYIQDINDYFEANAMHEVGHALLLIHTTYDDEYGIPYNVSRTVSSCGSNLVPLIMNYGIDLGLSLNVADRDHLRIRWGA